jgi:hypothetical protein
MYLANSLFKSATHFGFDLLCPVRLRRKEKAAIPLGAESTEHRVLRRRSSEYFWMRPCALSFLSAPDGVVGHLFAPGPTDASKVECQTAVQRAPRAVRITRGIAWGQVIHEIDMFDFVADHRAKHSSGRSRADAPAPGRSHRSPKVLSDQHDLAWHPFHGRTAGRRTTGARLPQDRHQPLCRSMRRHYRCPCSRF